MADSPLAESLKNLPDRAGVYLFKDARGKLLYVGKAESLRDRVRSYFQAGEPVSPKIHRVVAQAHTVEYILTESPIQALIWENDLVRKEQPKYNTKLRDDKHYPYIRIDVQNPWPVARVSRRMERDGARYFGPFPHATSVRQTLDTLSRLFPHILCNRTITGTDPRACLYYHIRRCPAPCIGAIDNAGYRAIVDDMIRFLDGKNRTVLQDLKREMQAAAENLQFERAADLRDRLRAAQKVIEGERVAYSTLVNQDIIGLAREGGHACLQVFFIRGGRLARRDPFLMQDAEGETDRAVLTSFVKQFYSQASELPQELVLPDDVDEAESIREWIRQVKGQRVELIVPKRGERRRMVDLAAANARETLELQKAEWLADSARTSEAALELQEELGLPNLPRRIECYDISNIQGTSSVASMVVFEDGKPKRSDYKRFKIKTVEGANDFASMQEVLGRRFKRALGPHPPALLSQAWERGGTRSKAPEDGEQAEDVAWAAIPDLVIIDGGKGQLSAGVEVMDELELSEIPIVGLAKQHEEIFLKDRAEPVLLPRTSQALYLVQRIRDEAHRFAITYHRRLRTKSGLRSQLEEVPGVGPTRRRALLRKFGSLKALAEASIEELVAVPGVSRPAAEAIKRALG
ncbi:MAG TPA: excinuclease ABC subunit UvrC [Chloroflexota bacterium]|nr:excinuclease ABC subunit UvrC [Chloroflexota bacterium]